MKKHSSKSKSKHTTHKHKKKRNFSNMQIILTLYGFLFAMYFVFSFIPAENGNPISDLIPFKPFDLEQIIIKLIFLVFIFAVFQTWKNKLVSGLLLVLCWGGMWAVGHFIVTPMGRDANTVALGFPMIIFGLIYIVDWFRKK